MTLGAQQGLNAYQNQQHVNLTDREIDARALLRCADRMQIALDNKGSDMKEYAAAVKHNQKLWTIFQVALCDTENLLAADLKITLLNLSRYVDKVSFRIVTEFLPDQLASLISINRIIATGLMKKPENRAGQTTPQVTQAPTMPIASVMTSI